MNVCSIWQFAEISDDLYYLSIWQCARYFVAALFKELALNCHQRSEVSNFQVSVSAFLTKSRSRLEILARSRSRRYGLDYVTAESRLSKIYDSDYLISRK